MTDTTWFLRFGAALGGIAVGVMAAGAGAIQTAGSPGTPGPAPVRATVLASIDNVERSVEMAVCGSASPLAETYGMSLDTPALHRGDIAFVTLPNCLGILTVIEDFPYDLLGEIQAVFSPTDYAVLAAAQPSARVIWGKIENATDATQVKGIAGIVVSWTWNGHVNNLLFSTNVLDLEYLDLVALLQPETLPTINCACPDLSECNPDSQYEQDLSDARIDFNTSKDNAGVEYAACLATVTAVAVGYALLCAIGVGLVTAATGGLAAALAAAGCGAFSNAVAGLAAVGGYAKCTRDLLVECAKAHNTYLGELTKACANLQIRSGCCD